MIILIAAKGCSVRSIAGKAIEHFKAKAFDALSKRSDARSAFSGQMGEFGIRKLELK